MNERERIEYDAGIEYYDLNFDASADFNPIHKSYYMSYFKSLNLPVNASGFEQFEAINIHDCRSINGNFEFLNEMKLLRRIIIENIPMKSQTIRLNCQNLEYLNITRTSNVRISGLENSNNLQILRLQKNHLTSIPDGIDKLSNLKHLDISKNNITQLPKTVLLLPNLKSITCDEVVKNFILENYKSIIKNNSMIITIPTELKLPFNKLTTENKKIWSITIEEARGVIKVQIFFNNILVKENYEIVQQYEMDNDSSLDGRDIFVRIHYADGNIEERTISALKNKV